MYILSSEMFAEDGMNRVNGELVGHLLRSMGYSLPQRWIKEYAHTPGISYILLT